jgi:hypothetical protein
MKRKMFFCAAFAIAATALAGCYPMPPYASPPPAPVVNAMPTWPIPSDTPAAPPAIASLPPASSTAPPANRIADPVTTAATCGAWHQQTNYGDRWSAVATWWEYSCSASTSQYHNICPGPICNAWCPDCWTEFQARIDYFSWDGTHAVFYGQSYSDSVQTDQDAADGVAPTVLSSHWWDGPTTQWYDMRPRITSFTPTAGPIGTNVLIVGANFSNATEVWFSPTAGYPRSALFTVDSNSQIHATVPTDATTAQIGVFTPDGITWSAASFTVQPT